MHLLDLSCNGFIEPIMQQCVDPLRLYFIPDNLIATDLLALSCNNVYTHYGSTSFPTLYRSTLFPSFDADSFIRHT